MIDKFHFSTENRKKICVYLPLLSFQNEITFFSVISLELNLVAYLFLHSSKKKMVSHADRFDQESIIYSEAST